MSQCGIKASEDKELEGLLKKALVLISYKKVKEEEAMFAEYPDVVDVYTLAEMLQISRRAAYTLLGEGAIKHRKIGRIYRIPKKAIIDFMTK